MSSLGIHLPLLHLIAQAQDIHSIFTLQIFLKTSVINIFQHTKDIILLKQVEAHLITL